MRFAYRIVNVFTVESDPFSGNPLCVFEDARGLADHQLQALARQLNLSETTFVLPSERATARVRIFTPAFEMPFAGHPTLGTAHVVRTLCGDDRLTLEMHAGVVSVTADGNTWTLCAAKAPRTRAVAATLLELASMVGLPLEAIAGEPRWVDTGVEQLVIPIASAAHVHAARPVPELITRYANSATRNEAMAYLWSPDGAVRYFFTQHGAVCEDPATGSACANLGGYLVATGRALPIAMTLHQGDAVRRPSRLELRVDADGSIRVAGAVIELGGGAFEL
jgi:PhzF family phenazine biosynthesis protein